MDDSNHEVDPLAIALREMAASAQGHNNDAIVPSGQRPCPICGTHMIVIEEHGISVDICEDHGVWLDQGEMAVLLERTYWHRRESEFAHVKMDRIALTNETAMRFSSGMKKALHGIGAI